MARAFSGPYDGLSDREVLARAQAALRKAASAAPGSIAWSVQWTVYDSAAGELRRRLRLHLAAHPQGALAVLDALEAQRRAAEW